MATHSSILAWKISWTEEPGGLQSMGSPRVGNDCTTNTHVKHRFLKPEGFQLLAIMRKDRIWSLHLAKLTAC